MPMEVQSPSAVPLTQGYTWSMAALAAEAADEAPRASMIAAPRLVTVGVKPSAIHSSSFTPSAAFLPATVAWKMSGYWVAEWLPQIVRRLMSATEEPVF